MWYQRDSSPVYYGRPVIEWVSSHYLNRWIGRVGPIARPPWSPELHPLDLFLWDHLQ